ncbi:MAG: cellulase family glycosylhydrolase [Kiritimatiellaeota bacterium]|nr:cellulase family glycosylhydrolase [Kiritimatiellota bacterium]
MKTILAAGVAAVSIASANGTSLPAAFPDSIGVQLKNGSDWTVETIDKAYALGFRIIRKGVYWNDVEKQKGVYSFHSSEKQIEHADKLGMMTVVTLFASNDLYEKQDGVRGVITEEGRRGYAKFAAAAAAKYKGKNVVFEIWNEPNVRTFWGSHGTHNTRPFAEQYAALVNSTVPEMLRADPDAFVAAGSVSNYWEPSYQWTEFCFQNGVLKSGIKAWSTHPYGVTNPEEHATGHTRTRELLKKYGAPDLPIINTERGFAVSKTATGEGWSGGSADKTLDYQAWHFARQLLIDQLNGVKFSVWYEFSGNENFGLWNPDGSPRPIVATLKMMFDELSGYSVVRRIESDWQRDYVLLLRNDAGEQKLALWTAPAPGESPDTTFAHDIEITVGGATRKFALTGAPQYFAVPKGAEIGKARALAKPQGGSGKVAEAPKEAIKLNLFGNNAAGLGWSFIENTGKGSFVKSKDETGRAVGVLNYDFSQSKSNTTPYVMASTALPAEIPDGCKTLTLSVRTAIPQPLTFRITDRTGQTLQYKTRVKEQDVGGWVEISIPLDKKLEHWDGANDGVTHFPVKTLTLSVPLPSQENKTGKVEYAEAFAK